MCWLIFLFSVPYIYEAWTDRKGENRSDKLKDTLILIGVAVILSVATYFYLDVPILKSIALLLGWRILIFDYLVSYLLIWNDVIVGHWFTYNGKTAWFDRFVSRVHPVVRLLIRVILFGVALFYYLVSPK